MRATGETILAALANYKLRAEGAGKWRCNSPLRTGSDSQSFAITINPDMEHGAYKDFVSGEAGSLYDLADKLGIEVPRKEVADTKRGYSGLADYAKAHGVDVGVYAAAGWAECRAKDRDGKERPALSFPTQSGTRYRFTDGEKPPYHSPGGYKRVWYGLRRAVELARQENKPLVFCNGEASVVAAQHYGVPAVAVAGGAEQIPDNLMAELRSAWQGDMLIAMDCDPQGKAATDKFSAQLPAARIVDLGLSSHGDLADFCALHGDTAAAELNKRGVKLEQYQEVNDLAALAATIKELVAARKSDENVVDLPGLVAKAEAEISHIKERTRVPCVAGFGEVVDANHKRLVERRKNPDYMYLKSHLPHLDNLAGGWQPGNVFVLYGDTGMGKSTLSINITLEWMKQHDGLIVPTEITKEGYLDKYVAALAKVPIDKILKGIMSDAEFARVEMAYAELETMGCNILDSGSPTPQDVDAELKAGGGKYKWVLIDSLSNMSVPGERDIYNTTRLVSNDIRDICRAHAIPFLVTSQIGRNLKDRAVKMPQLNDGKGAGEIEQNAAFVFSVYRHHYYVKAGLCNPIEGWPENKTLVTCLKDRWMGNEGKTVSLVYVGGAGFYEESKNDDPPTQQPLNILPLDEDDEDIKSNAYLHQTW